MKRSEIIDLLDATGQLMDLCDHVEIKIPDTDEVVGTISKDAIHGMQTAMLCCIGLLDGTRLKRTHLELASRMLNLYAAVIMSPDEDSHEGTEYHVADGDDAND